MKLKLKVAIVLFDLAEWNNSLDLAENKEAQLASCY
jgi:hypothetical protein